MGSEMDRTGTLLCGLTSLGGCGDKTVLEAMRCSMQQSHRGGLRAVCKALCMNVLVYSSQHICNSTSVTVSSFTFLIGLRANSV